MSKIISDEEFFKWCGSHIVKGCGKTRTTITDGEETREVTKCEDCRAEAQRDSSDREWIEAGDKLRKEYGRLPSVVWNFWTLLKQKVTGEQQ